MDDDKLDALLRYGPFLDQVEAALQGHPATEASVSLQRDAANLYAGFPAENIVTEERVRIVFGELYLAYNETKHGVFLSELQEMMNELGIAPSLGASRNDSYRQL